MSFTPIDSSILDVGDPLKKDLFDLIRANEIDLNTRMSAQEVKSAKVPFMKFYLLNASSFSTATALVYYEADQNFTITDAFIRIFEKGTLTGTIEIDIKKSTTDLNSTSFTSIFTTKPSITLSTAADYAASTNKVFNSSLITVQKGNFLRLDITQAPSNGVLPKLLISVYGE